MTLSSMTFELEQVACVCGYAWLWRRVAAGQAMEVILVFRNQCNTIWRDGTWHDRWLSDLCILTVAYYYDAKWPAMTLCTMKLVCICQPVRVPGAYHHVPHFGAYDLTYICYG